jgi:hypothetical protein
VAREPIDLSMGHANVIWQGDANDWALRALAHCTAPTRGLNVSGPAVRIREVARPWRSAWAWRRVHRAGGADGLAGRHRRGREAVRPAAVPMDTLLDWTADWVARDMASLGKPTHYEARDGKY